MSPRKKLKLSSIHKEIPAYLRAKYQLIATVTFTAFFSLAFMLMSIPFSHNAWFQLGASQAFGFTALFFTIALLVIIISKRLMYATRSIIKMSYLHYILWNIAEVVVICLLYTAFSFQGDYFGIIHLKETSALRLFCNAFVYAFMSLIIPCIISGMYFALIDKNNTIRLINYNNVLSDDTGKASYDEKVSLFDNSGALKLSVNLKNLYFIESDDNYIIVWYVDGKEELKRYMIRCRLKTVEESFKGSPLVRCHRKYIVNLDKVKVLRKEKDGYELELENDKISPIPITKTYSENVLSRFSSSGSPVSGVSDKK